MSWVKMTKAVLLFWIPAVLFFGSVGCWWHHDDHHDDYDHHDVHYDHDHDRDHDHDHDADHDIH